MSFFWKKQSPPPRNDTHEMVDAKVHVMQHDLDEIAKNGHLEIDSSEKSEVAASSSEEVASVPRIPTDGPFSHPIFPSSDAPFPDVTSTVETPPPTPPAPPEEVLPEKPLPEPPVSEPLAPPPTPPTPSEAVSEEPLSSPAPSFLEKPPVSNHEAVSVSAPPSPTPPESKSRPASSRENQSIDRSPIRTGAWPEPFGGGKKKTPHSRPAASASPSKNFPIRKPTVDKAILSENIILKDRWGWKQALSGVLVLGILFGGFFFFQSTRFPELDLSKVSFLDIELNPSAEEIRVEPEPIPESEANLPFTLSKPNVFLIDVETQSVSMLRETLLAHGKTLAESDISAPVPFSVVDKNNVPIAFFIFASVFNLGLSGDLLNSLDNDFTMWVVLDAGSPRLVLSVRIKHADDVAEQLSLSEKTFPVSLKNLFLTEEGALQSIETEFGDGLYRGVLIRYRNFQSETPLSLDYGIVDTKLILGTSRDSTRAVIDRILEKKQ